METIAELDLIILSYLVPLMSLLCGLQYNSYVIVIIIIIIIIVIVIVIVIVIIIIIIIIIIIMTCCGLHPLPTKCLEVATCHQQTIKIGFHPIAGYM